MPTSQYRALVVDDERTMQRLVHAALATEGFACDCAADGTEALQRVAANEYDVVVTDLRMPNRHGHALAMDLLTLAQRPVIFIYTGVNDPRLAKDLLLRGVDDVMVKPANLSILATKAKVLAERRRAERAAAKGQESSADPQITQSGSVLSPGASTTSWPEVKRRLETCPPSQCDGP